MNICRTLVVAALFGFLAANAAPASTRRSSALGVSVQVTRSCRVASGSATVDVACSGRAPAPVRVAIDGGESPPRTSAAPRPQEASRDNSPGATPTGLQTITVNF